jgi:hypothetical protein
MVRMPAPVFVAVALAVILGVEALGVLGYFAATGSGRGVESAGVFIVGVLVMVNAGQFVADAVHRRAVARVAAIRKALPIAGLAAIALPIAVHVQADAGEEIPRRVLVAVALGFIAPLALLGLLLLGRAARAWFNRAGPVAGA